MSKWHIQPMTKDQQIYAAIDVYVSTSTSVKLNVDLGCVEAIKGVIL